MILIKKLIFTILNLTDILINVDYDFVFEFYKSKNIESFFEKLMERDVILNKIELTDKIENKSYKLNKEIVTLQHS